MYDTERVIRVIGEDGKVDVVSINTPAGEAVDGVNDVMNDVTIGAYDVSIDMGPSYTTKREEAREGMLQLLQTAPNVAPLIMDLVAKSQDWPLADKIAERFKTTLPPEIQAKEAAESGEDPPMPPPAPPPDPKVEAEAVMAQADVEMKKIDLQIAELKLAVEEAKAAQSLAPQPMAASSGGGEAMPQGQPEQPGALDEIMVKLVQLEQAMVFMQDHVTGAFEDGGGMGMEPPDEMGGPPPDMMPQAEMQPPPGGFFNGQETQP